MSLLELTKLIIALSGSKSKIVFKKLPIDDPKQRQPDINRAKKMLNCKPKVKIKDGLKKTIAWFKLSG